MKKYILNRPMFKQVTSPAYGTGISANLVSNEQRQRYNYGGRVGLETGTELNWKPLGESLKPAWDWWKEGSKMAWGIPGVYQPGETMGTVDGEEITYPDIYGKARTKYYQSKAREAEARRLEEQGRSGAGGAHPLAFQHEDTVDIGMQDLTDESRRQQSQTSPEVFEEETNISDFITSKVTPGAKEKTQAEILKDQLKKDIEEGKTQGKVAALAEGVSMASNLLTEPTMAKALAKAGKQAPALLKAGIGPGQAAKKTARQFDMLEALQTQKDEAALIKEKEEWKGKKDIYEFLNIESEEAAEKSFENKKEILELAQLSPDKGFRNFIADKGGDAFSMAQGINAFSPKGGFTAVAAEWQTMKDKKKQDLFSKNKGNVIIDGQGQMIFIAEDGSGHSITLKDLGLEDDRETLDIESITTS
tara:strand:+ start:283 stop:1536 length:1254 start_codon:yes stop_codon:yes gene_type:complete